MQKKYLIVLVSMAVLLFIAAWGCTFNNEEEYFSEIENDTVILKCDTINITYTKLTYIFTNVCNECHFPGNEGYTNRPNILMDSYDHVKASFNTGLVIPAIEHTGQYKMPKDRDKLSDCDISKIEAWYHAGMPEK